jgi:hypothetical protein
MNKLFQFDKTEADSGRLFYFMQWIVGPSGEKLRVMVANKSAGQSFFRILVTE